MLIANVEEFLSVDMNAVQWVIVIEKEVRSVLHRKERYTHVKIVRLHSSRSLHQMSGSRYAGRVSL